MRKTSRNGIRLISLAFSLLVVAACKVPRTSQSMTTASETATPIERSKLDDILEYLVCQNSLSLYACAGLGGAVAGRLSLPLVQSYRAQLVANPMPLTKKYFFNEMITRDLRSLQVPLQKDEYPRLLQEGWRNSDEVMKKLDQPYSPAGPKPSFRPVLRYVRGLDVFVDIANTPFSKWPKTLLFSFENQAAIDWYWIEYALKNGRQFKSPQFRQFVIDEIATKIEWVESTDEFVLDVHTPTHKARLAAMERELDRALTIFSQVEKQAVQELKNSKTLIAVLRKTGSRGFMLAGGPLGIALAVLSDQLFSTPLGCASTSDLYKNLDSNCKPSCAADQRVISFLTKPREEREQIRREVSDVGSYYEECHRQYFRQPDILDIDCKAKEDTIDLKIRKHILVDDPLEDTFFKKHPPVSWNQTLTVSLDRNKWVKQIHVQNSDAANVAPLYSVFFEGMNMNQTYYERHGSTLERGTAESWPALNQAVREFRLYIPDVVECCKQSNNDGCKAELLAPRS